jgi:transcriptional regulator with PAS, ATPase and Fis domain
MAKGPTIEAPFSKFAQKKTMRIARKENHETVSYLKYKLVMEEGPAPGYEYVIDREKIRVGAHPENEVVIQDETVSRHHLEIQATEKGHRVRDLESTNGTQLDGCQIMDAILHPGARLALGDVTLVFKPLKERVEIPLSSKTSFGNMLGPSISMRALFHLAERVVPHDTTVLITGETGTGKGLLAQEIHLAGSRKEKPFVVVDCSTIPPRLMESELFGHVQGAFTGALYTRPGAFQEAGGGTIFFDEIGEIPPPMQAKLLRVLEDREIKPVGSTESIKLDVRIMAATNCNLKAEVEKMAFREDLYFRLNVFGLKIPPLRERKEDIPHLVKEFLKAFSKGADRRFSEDAMRLLVRHDWPGNVRELRNVIERVARLIDDKVIGSASLLSAAITQVSAPTRIYGLHGHNQLPINEAKEAFEKEYLQELLRRHDYNVTAAARTAGVHRQSLHRLMRKHDIKTNEKTSEVPVERRAGGSPL